MKEILYVVIPCYKEEAVLPETARRLEEKMKKLIETNQISPESKVLFVNDGSNDRTWEIIENLHEKNELFAGVNLSRNCGHQNALLAGMTVAVNYADMLVSMDADLQDDINAMDEMIDNFQQGYEVVYGVRSERKKDTWFKRCTAQGFYKFMAFLGAEIVYNHADYRLMSKRAVEALLEFEEVHLFLRGIVPLIGYRWTTVAYERGERFAGESKYPLKKMISFAFDGITSFSIKPIRFVLNIGLLISAFSFVMLFWTLIEKFVGTTVPGWTSLMVSVWMLGGIQLICLGVIGEYVGKIYGETKKRPKFFIERTII
ncbi:MAG: glycosyltransferase family 2 protein [Lachnospiraceae bacterium]|nr:glycosyltransferase family 2 protein [Lachnospiraceae bacterium]